MGTQVGRERDKSREVRVEVRLKRMRGGNSRLYFLAVSLKKASSSERALALARECLDLREAFRRV